MVHPFGRPPGGKGGPADGNGGTSFVGIGAGIAGGKPAGGNPAGGSPFGGKPAGGSPAGGAD